MGGRGSSSGIAAGRTKKSGGGSSNSAANKILSANTKFSTAQINSLNRSQLETAAIAIFAKQNTARGLSIEEAIRRAKSLMSGNTTAQLKKYIKRNG